MKYGDKVGWLGVLFGMGVAPAQLVKIWMTGNTEAISVVTYTFLLLAMSCYLYHAVHLRSKVFITAQSINLVVNFAILMYLIGG